MDARDTTPDLGTAGASARREHERRKANRERRVRENHPRFGGLILALQDDPAHERVWARGAEGEEQLASFLAKHLSDDVRVLHDRRIPHSRANIDHIAIAASGVWVIDAKRYSGNVAVRKPLFRRPKLLIAGRDKSKLADGLARQVELVRAALVVTAPEMPVQGALCFVDGDLPRFGTLTFEGFPLLRPKQLVKRVDASGPVTSTDASAALAALARRFPPA